MDTGSHVLFGLTLAGLALIDPVIASDSHLALAVGAAVVVGSNAPDFDGVIRLKGYAYYVRHHRGWSHAWPAWFVWAALVALPIAWLFGVQGELGRLYAWTLGAVAWHVLLDLFNAYGVQWLRPSSRRWWHLDCLPLFDPVLGALHVSGLVGWFVFGVEPGPLFVWIYAATAGYIALRWGVHGWLRQTIRRQLGQGDRCMIVPGLWLHRWQFAIETEREYRTGHLQIGWRLREPVMTVRHRYAKDGEGEGHEIVGSTLGTDGVRAFLQFAQYIHVRWTKQDDGYVVQWRDVRFWNDRELPFGVDVQLDRELKVVHQRLGWTKRYWEAPYV